MNKSIFKKIVIMNLLILIVETIIILFFYEEQPINLVSCSNISLVNNHFFVEIFDYIGSFLVIVSNIGLIFFLNWARIFYIIGLFIMIVSIGFSGQYEVSSLQESFYILNFLLDGFIIALAYYSDVKVFFEPKFK